MPQQASMRLRRGLPRRHRQTVHFRRGGRLAHRFRHPGAGRTVVGGRPFAQWGRPQQHALLLATVTHYATGENEGGSTDRWTESWGQVHVVPIMKTLQALR